MRVAVLYNAVSQQDSIEDRDVLVQVESVLESLNRLGHEHFTAACTLDLDSMRKTLLALRPEVVFNLVESLHGCDSLIHLAPAVLDSLGMPYTGSCAESLLLTTNKLLAKQRLVDAGLPTPDWIVQDMVDGKNAESVSLASGTRTKPLSPGEGTVSQWIIKGVWEQGSRDMDDDAVFTGDITEVNERLRERVCRTNRPAFAEQYIEGREFNLAMLTAPGGMEFLPIAEIDFSAFPLEKPRIVGYRAKWHADSFEYNNTPPSFDFSPADRVLIDRLHDLARQCWKLFMLGGWGRVDFRVDQNGRPWILEVNARSEEHTV